MASGSSQAAYEVKIAEAEEEILGAQRLRYRVFVEEMGADARDEERTARREWDRYDRHFNHLILISREIAVEDPLDRVVGAYRLMRDGSARDGIGFYSADEYDLSPIMESGRSLVEVGRSCVAKEHRGGMGMHLLWNELARYVLDHGIEILFGVASFHGTDPAPFRDALALLHHRHLAPPDLRVRARDGNRQEMDLCALADVDTLKASAKIPPLIKSYLRLGGFVGDGAFIDHDFNTTDVCIVMDTERMKEGYRRFYERNRTQPE